MIKMDYTDDFALFDAYLGFHPGAFNLYMGQKHNQINNREMNSDEGYLTYLERSLVSTVFSRTAREFGIFVEKTQFKDVGKLKFDKFIIYELVYCMSQ